MRAWSSLVVVVAVSLSLTVGCGKSDGDDGSDAAAGQTTGGASAGQAGAAAAGKAGEVGSGGSGGVSAGGKPSAGDGGRPSGGASTGGVGGASDGGASSLVDCDPRKIVCKRVAPECGVMEVPSVDGSCYGECVKIERCACDGPDACPDSNRYTCWNNVKHCGPYLK